MLKGKKSGLLNSVFAVPVVSAVLLTQRMQAQALEGPVLGTLDQPSVMGHDFVLWQMKGKFQGH